jgi:uncharacterized protein
LVLVKDVAAELINAVDTLHRAIDDNARAIAERNKARLQCKRGCSGCCVDDLTVFEVEAAAIVRKHSALLETGAPHPVGRCAFLDDEGGCRIYEERPYVCRTQGLPLRWIEGTRELRDICTLNAAGEPIEALPDAACWPIGPVEARLAAMQERTGSLTRVSLRGLFKPRTS